MTSNIDGLGQQSGTEFARTKEQQAAIMRAKQDAGMFSRCPTHRQQGTREIKRL